MISMKNDRYLVEIEGIGEGFAGDYDPTVPDDAPLLRFYVSEFEEDGMPEAVPDGSYCTLLKEEEATEPRLLAAAYLISPSQIAAP